jgi:hypothetical protein
MEAIGYCYDQLHDAFFVAANGEEIQAWNFDVLRAMRDGDLEKLRGFHELGRPLKCSNKFGESLPHMACRKGLAPIIDFLVNEAQVPVQMADDMGRTLLHDAFWTPQPNFEVIDLIIGKCPHFCSTLRTSEAILLWTALARLTEQCDRNTSSLAPA